MLSPRANRRKGNRVLALAFTRKELLVVLIAAGLLASVAAIVLRKAALRSRNICCNCNLKQIGLGFRTWEIDHTNLYPMAVSTNFGGTLECVGTGETFRHFEIMSNELSTPRVLVCPSDSRRPAQSFGAGFANSNLSYFVGIVSNSDNPQMFLSGDRSPTGGVRLASGIMELSTNGLAGWGADIHKGCGNIALADGSVQGFSTLGLREALKWTGSPTSRVAMP
jgi:hypothetical protein